MFYKNGKDNKQRFSLRKYTFGAMSVLLGTLFVVAGVGAELPSAQVAKAATVREATDITEFLNLLKTARSGDTIRVSFTGTTLTENNVGGTTVTIDRDLTIEAGAASELRIRGLNLETTANVTIKNLNLSMVPISGSGTKPQIISRTGKLTLENVTTLLGPRQQNDRPELVSNGGDIKVISTTSETKFEKIVDRSRRPINITLLGKDIRSNQGVELKRETNILSSSNFIDTFVGPGTIVLDGTVLSGVNLSDVQNLTLIKGAKITLADNSPQPIIGTVTLDTGTVLNVSDNKLTLKALQGSGTYEMAHTTSVVVNVVSNGMDIVVNNPTKNYKDKLGTTYVHVMTGTPKVTLKNGEDYELDENGVLVESGQVDKSYLKEELEFDGYDFNSNQFIPDATYNNASSQSQTEFKKILEEAVRIYNDPKVDKNTVDSIIDRVAAAYKNLTPAPAENKPVTPVPTQPETTPGATDTNTTGVTPAPAGGEVAPNSGTEVGGTPPPPTTETPVTKPAVPTTPPAPVESNPGTPVPTQPETTPGATETVTSGQPGTETTTPTTVEGATGVNTNTETPAEATDENPKIETPAGGEQTPPPTTELPRTDGGLEVGTPTTPATDTTISTQPGEMVVPAEGVQITPETIEKPAENKPVTPVPTQPEATPGATETGTSGQPGTETTTPTTVEGATGVNTETPAEATDENPKIETPAGGEQTPPPTTELPRTDGGVEVGTPTTPATDTTISTQPGEMVVPAEGVQTTPETPEKPVETVKPAENKPVTPVPTQPEEKPEVTPVPAVGETTPQGTDVSTPNAGNTGAGGQPVPAETTQPDKPIETVTPSEVTKPLETLTSTQPGVKLYTDTLDKLIVEARKEFEVATKNNNSKFYKEPLEALANLISIADTGKEHLQSEEQLQDLVQKMTELVDRVREVNKILGKPHFVDFYAIDAEGNELPEVEKVLVAEGIFGAEVLIDETQLATPPIQPGREIIDAANKGKWILEEWEQDESVENTDGIYYPWVSIWRFELDKENQVDVTQGKGNVVVNYLDENGNPLIEGVYVKLATEEKVVIDGVEMPLSPVGEKYNTEALRKDVIETADGKLWVVVDLSEISGPEQGEVEEGTIEVEYVYRLFEIATGTGVEEKVKSEIPIEKKVPGENLFLEAKPEIPIEKKVLAENLFLEVKPEIPIEKKVLAENLFLETKPEIPITDLNKLIVQTSKPQSGILSLAILKPEIKVEFAKGEIELLAELPKLTLQQNGESVGKVEPLFQNVKPILPETSLQESSLQKDEAEVIQTSTPQSGVLTLIEEKPELDLTLVAKDEVESEGKVLPKTSTTADNSVTFPLGLATVLAVAGTGAARCRKRNK